MKSSDLLGPLEAEVMEIMWHKSNATVREVVAILSEQRNLAYTTVMTVMNNLVDKGLLHRIPKGRAFTYTTALSRDEFFALRSEEAVNQVIEQYGDLAIARFLEAVADIDPEQLERLRKLASRKRSD